MSGSDTATTIEIALAVERLAIMFSQYRPEAVRTFGVSSQQAIILAAIYDEPGCGVKRITERTGMFQPVVSRSHASMAVARKPRTIACSDVICGAWASGR